MKNYLILVAGVIFLASCRTGKINRAVRSGDSALFTGVLISDTPAGKILFSRHGEKPFVPASNTKILTLYACMSTLGDSIPAFRYFTRQDTLFLLGTGDPTLLHPDFPESAALLLMKEAKAIVISDQNVQQAPYGVGWAWDDYNDYYQAELSSLPVYGNVVRASLERGAPVLRPGYFPLKDSLLNSPAIIRKPWENVFYYAPEAQRSNSFSQEIPFRTGIDLTARLLADTLKIPVIHRHFEITGPLKTAYSHPVDTVLRKMMQQSDNLLAEQLLLLAGGTLSDTLSTAVSIRHLSRHLLNDIALPYRWRDGSGLSRYNLFSPQIMVHILNKMYRSYPQERLFSLMSIGGKAGTLRNKYKTDAGPYVFAKTGSMSGVYNESGFLISRSGRLLTYSVMKNNFTNTVAENGKATMELVEMVRKKF